MAADGKSWQCPACQANVDASGQFALTLAIARHIREHENSSRNAAFEEARRNPGVTAQSRVKGLLTAAGFHMGGLIPDDHPAHVDTGDENDAPPAPWDDAAKLNEFDRTVLYCYRVLWHAGDDYPPCKP